MVKWPYLNLQLNLGGWNCKRKNTISDVNKSVYKVSMKSCFQRLFHSSPLMFWKSLIGLFLDISQHSSISVSLCHPKRRNQHSLLNHIFFNFHFQKVEGNRTDFQRQSYLWSRRDPGSQAANPTQKQQAQWVGQLLKWCQKQERRKASLDTHMETRHGTWSVFFLHVLGEAGPQEEMREILDI